MLRSSNFGVAERAFSSNNTIECWITSHQEVPQSLHDDIFVRPSCVQQETILSAMCSQNDNLASEISNLEPQASSSHDPGHCPSATPWRAPGYLEVARQRLAVTMPGPPRRQPPALDIDFADQSCQTNPISWETMASVKDRASRGPFGASVSRPFIGGVSWQALAPLTYFNAVHESDSYRDGTFYNESSSTTPNSIFSNCSSTSYFEPPDLTDTNGCTDAVGQAYHWWPPDQLGIIPDTQRTTIQNMAHYNSQLTSLSMERGDVSKSDAVEMCPIGVGRISSLSDAKLSHITTQGPFHEGVEHQESYLVKPRSISDETCETASGALLSNNAQNPSFGSDGNESFVFAEWPEADILCSPVGGSEGYTRSHPFSPQLGHLRLRAQSGAHITSYPICQSPKKPIHRYSSNPRRTMLPSRNSPQDEVLLQLRKAGYSYKDVKTKGKFKEAESTLRGRFRTLTKDKDQRVRKPQWQAEDVSSRY